MSAIFYMMRKSVKNTLRELLRRPAKLAAYLAAAAILLFSALSQALLPRETGEPLLDIRLLEGAYLVLLLFIALPSLFAGMRSGASMFSMADVGMLFVSPLSPKRILLYGLIKQMGSTLLVAVCLLAYGGIAVSRFGIPVWFAMLLLLGVGLTAFIMQLLTMLIYSVTNGRPRRIRGAKAALALLLLAAGAYAGAGLYAGGFSLETAAAVASDPLLEWFPFVGWMKGFWFAVYRGNMPRAMVFAGLLLAGTAAAVLLFMRSDADYYEDVLQNAESTYRIKSAAKEGRVSAEGSFRRKIRVRDTGLGRGWGASAFFYKHLREIKRRSRFAFIGWTTLALTAGVVFLTQLLLRTAESDDGMSANLAMMIGLIAGLYLLFFTQAAGEWGREMAKPYLYLAPCPPFKKLLWASMTSLIKPAVDGLIAFLAAGIACGATPLTTGMCILLYTAFGALFTASSLFGERVLGGVANHGLLLFFYMLLLLLLMAPGLIAGFVLGGVLGDAAPAAWMGAPVVVWNLLVSLGIYALCRHTLHNMELK